MLTKFLCESITAFGVPVVPDVKISDATDVECTFAGSNALRFASSVSVWISKTSSNVHTATSNPASFSFSPSSGFSPASFGRDDDRRRFAGLGERDDLGDRARRIDRDRGRSCFEDAEIGHSPFGHVVREQNDAFIGADTVFGEETRRPHRQFADIVERVLLLAAVSLDPHRDAGREAFDRGIEQIEQVFVSIRTLFLCLQLLFESRQHPFSHSRKMDVEPVVVPVELFGIPRQQGLLFFLDHRLQCPHVVRPIQIFVIDHERFEHREGVHRLFGRLLERLDRLLQIRNDVADPAAAPTRTRFIEHPVGTFRNLVQHRRRGELIRPVGDGLRLDHSGELVDQLVAGFLVLEMPTFVEPDEPDDTFHIVRVRVAGRRLENERRVRIDEGVHRRGEDRTRDHIDRNDVEDQLFVDRNDRLTAKRDQNERRGRRKALVPARERIRLRRFDDGRPDKHLHDVVLLGDDLLGKRFRIRINIRPAPIFGTLGAEFGRAFADPHFAFAKDRRFQFGFVVRVAAFVDKALACLLAKFRRLHRVIGLLTCLFAQACAVLDLAIDIKNGPDKLIFSREIPDDRLVLPDRARAFAGDKTRRNVHQTRLFHHPRHLDDVVRTDDICPQGRLKRRIERHVAGTIDDDVGVTHYLFRVFFVEAEIFVADIAIDGHDLAI